MPSQKVHDAATTRPVLILAVFEVPGVQDR